MTCHAQAHLALYSHHSAMQCLECKSLNLLGSQLPLYFVYTLQEGTTYAGFATQKCHKTEALVIIVYLIVCSFKHLKWLEGVQYHTHFLDGSKHAQVTSSLHHQNNQTFPLYIFYPIWTRQYDVHVCVHALCMKVRVQIIIVSKILILVYKYYHEANVSWSCTCKVMRKKL